MNCKVKLADEPVLVPELGVSKAAKRKYDRIYHYEWKFSRLFSVRDPNFRDEQWSGPGGGRREDLHKGSTREATAVKLLVVAVGVGDAGG